ncbi:MAG TPA: class I SAM-dependent methyltransferase [Gammaproteobacteria bacterium]|nr:class I SAM-dependent methyltransferase [Gammaproteobacteria bacterium]
MKLHYLVVESFTDYAQTLHDKFGFILTKAPPNEGPYLSLKGRILSYHHGAEVHCIDFTKLPYRLHRYHPKDHTLLKAFGKLRNPSIVDMTAGFLKDSTLCCIISSNIIAIESNPLVAALVENALLRNPNDSIKFIYGASEEILQNTPCDVALIDPMFKEKKASSKSQKNLQTLQSLVQDQDYDHLLITALRHARQKVLVKRHPKAPYLGNLTPNHSLTSTKKTFRIDVYIPS